MQRFVTLVGCTITGLTLALQGAPMAQADNASFVADARALKFEESDDVLIRMGMSACRFLQPNLRRHVSDVEAHIARSTNLEPGSIPDPAVRQPEPAGDAHQFLINSVKEYCPELAYRLAN
jgi:hypothetical protein